MRKTLTATEIQALQDRRKVLCGELTVIQAKITRIDNILSGRKRVRQEAGSIIDMVTSAIMVNGDDSFSSDDIVDYFKAFGWKMNVASVRTVLHRMLKSGRLSVVANGPQGSIEYVKTATFAQ